MANIELFSDVKDDDVIKLADCAVKNTFHRGLIKSIINNISIVENDVTENPSYNIQQ